jgi:histidinol-phosphatase (PHP family)
MTYSNYHVHCSFCDGEGEPEEYIKQAIDYGFKSIGFSSHAPIPFDNTWAMREGRALDYCSVIRELKAKYQGIIDVYLGMEIDYIPNLTGPSKFKDLNLDYTIGSVHFVTPKRDGEYLSVDGPEENIITLLREVYDGDIKALVRDYYMLVRNMIETEKPDIVGHFDLVKKNNRGSQYFNEDEKWYMDEVLNTLECAAKSGIMIEINTGGITRGYMDVPYPSPWILKECRKLDIPVMLNSDAHAPGTINSWFENAVQVMKDAGYSEQKVLLNNHWEKVCI